MDMQALESHRSDSLIHFLWRAASPTPNLLPWTLSRIFPFYSSNTSWMLQTNFSDWDRSLMLNKSILWCLFPRFSRQAILQALSIWVESPTSCGHNFLVPKILQHDFGRLSKLVIYNGQYDSLPLSFTPIVPFVLYCIPPFKRMEICHHHQRQQEANRLDTPYNTVPSCIRKEIDYLLRVSSPNWFWLYIPYLHLPPSWLHHLKLYLTTMSGNVSCSMHQARGSLQNSSLW